MSTTVTYNGSTIGTAENSTLTLATESTWMEGDVTITDVTSGSSTLGTKSITANGTYTATDDDLDGYSSVTVNVSGSSATLGTLSATANGTYTASDDGYDGYSSVTVSVSGSGGYDINDLADGSEPSGAITIDTATSITQYAFHYRTAFTSVSAPVCTTVNKYAFEGCSGLTSISFPALTALGDYCFYGCTGLTAVAFPSFASATKARCFGGCTNMTVADLGNCTSLNNQTFINSTALRTLILRNTSSVATCGAWNVYCLAGIYNNPTESTIYVPSALLSSYISATNWSSAYSAGVTFTAIEGSTYETYYGDGTAIS